ncbi:MurR/RpiR family transcriptional regulator [Luteipulveratus mongoliensis]|uniref:RpiR family transcriptional regulator n=1 Tax=Luteipulveratus mongoliensis TaxID=571913 RepID=A0A0K1JFM7_9MICO|nr:MurR/RpiR family transcriptional regulator [Luteipulveratus mongoliensis]AKU15506.1 RpiR family transcriptional regulator [Luteipulveratus mongoliensis]
MKALRGRAYGAQQRIRLHRSEMSSAMAKLADLILADPAAPIELSITELAERAGTSAATVTRFCRVLGYSGYVALRVGVASDIGRGDAQASWRTDIGQAFGPDDSVEDVVQALVSSHTRSIETTASTLDLADLEEVAVRIAEGRQVDLYGVGGSGVMAVELQSRLYRIGLNAHAWTEVHAGLASAAIQSEDSVAIGISHTGATQETIQMLAQARSAGAFTVAITSKAGSPLTDFARKSLTSATIEHYLQPDDLSAKHSQLFVVDVLYLLVAQQDFVRTTTNLAASAMAVSPHRKAPRGVRHNERKEGAR